MKQVRRLWEKIKADQITVQIITFSTGIIVGMIIFPTLVNFEFWGFVTGLLPEIAGILFTILVLNTWADIRSRKELREQLYSDLHSHSNDAVLNALHRLRVKGWLFEDYFMGKDFQRANWEGAYIGGLNFQTSDLRKANLKNTTCINTEQHQGVNFKNTQLTDANFNGANLYHANFDNSNLYRTQLEGVILQGANMSGANLNEANLNGSSLWGTNLTGANLLGAYLHGAILQSANLEGANLRGAYLLNVVWTENSDNRTKLPDGKIWTHKENDKMERFTNPHHPEFKATLEEINSIRIKQGRDPLK